MRGSTTPTRVASANDLLEASLATHSDSTRSALLELMSSAEAMEMAVELRSTLREYGDQAAHADLRKVQFHEAIEEHCRKGGMHGQGLKVFLKFLFPQ